jgi:hypothetical protein
MKEGEGRWEHKRTGKHLKRAGRKEGMKIRSKKGTEEDELKRTNRIIRRKWGGKRNLGLGHYNILVL